VLLLRDRVQLVLDAQQPVQHVLEHQAPLVVVSDDLQGVGLVHGRVFETKVDGVFVLVGELAERSGLVDCHAWGENIVTCGNPRRPNDRTGYAVPPGTTFSGTSGASAIIAGVCLLIQHLCTLLRAKSGSGKLGAYHMRRMLRDRKNGAGTTGPAENIGCMPDFTRILANEFNP
jgi:hypothetical protein